MKTVRRLEEAKVFPSHRLLVGEIVDLQAKGLIDGYSIHARGGGVSAGVRIHDQWGYLG